MVLLGDLHIMGKGVLKNASLAFGLYQRAGKAGDAIAQYRTGTLYQEGIGTPFDLKRLKNGCPEPPSRDIRRPVPL